MTWRDPFCLFLISLIGAAALYLFGATYLLFAWGGIQVAAMIYFGIRMVQETDLDI